MFIMCMHERFTGFVYIRNQYNSVTDYDRCVDPQIDILLFWHNSKFQISRSYNGLWKYVYTA